MSFGSAEKRRVSDILRWHGNNAVMTTTSLYTQMVNFKFKAHRKYLGTFERMYRRLTQLRAMPLRARIMNSKVPLMRNLSSSAVEEPVVKFNSDRSVRTILLNRPKKLNSLNDEMVDLILPRLIEWSRSDAAQIILLKGAGDKSFCAGGDVTHLAKAIGPNGNAEGIAEAVKFFGAEYILDQYVATYEKPYVAFMNGITMGGGVGLSVHAPFRIATEKTLFAMPETNIGLYPDVGGSFFLSRLDGAIGTYLGLTSDRLKGYDVFLSGIASHYIPSDRLDEVEARLSDLNANAVYRQPVNIYELVNNVLEELSEQVPQDYVSSIGGEKRDIIDECFRHDSVEKILQALENNGSSFALKSRDTILERCPMSLKVALASIQKGRNLDISTALKSDFYVSENMMHHPDFAEGVTALLIDKPARKPKWNPATLMEVNDSVVSTFLLRRKDGAPDINFESSQTYLEYPHQRYSLPKEKSIMDYVIGTDSGRDFKATRAEVIDHFVRQSGGKVSVEYKVNQVLDRCTTPDPTDPTLLDWKY